MVSGWWDADRDPLPRVEAVPEGPGYDCERCDDGTPATWYVTFLEDWPDTGHTWLCDRHWEEEQAK